MLYDPEVAVIVLCCVSKTNKKTDSLRLNLKIISKQLLLSNNEIPESVHIRRRERRKLSMKEAWYLYILECSDATYYTGIAKDISARLEKHNAGKGAKYTKSRGPARVVYYEELEDHKAALKREVVVKRLSRTQKKSLIDSVPADSLHDILRPVEN